MSDMGDDFRAMKIHSQQKRAGNRDSSAQLLKEKDIHFTSNNGGAHLIVEGNDGFIDFWPGTGRWNDRKGTKGFGVMNLIRHIKGV
jgi:hypothetical protein